MKTRIAVVLLFAVTAAVHAQSLSDSAVKVVYFHKTNHAEVQTLNGKNTLHSVSADTDEHLEIHAPRTVPICIADPNPVFYKYSKGKTTFTPNPNWAALLAFAKAIEPVRGQLEFGLPTEQTETRTRLDDARDTIKKYAADIPTIAMNTLSDETLATAKSDVRAWDLDEIAADLADPFAASVAPPVTSNNRGSNDAHGLTPDIVNNSNQNNSKNSPPQPTVADLLNRIKALEDQQKTATNEALQRQQEQQKKADEAKTMLKTLQEFKKAVLGVNDPICLEGEAISPENDATIHIVIEPLPAIPDLQPPPRKAGDIKIPTRAYSPVDLGFGAGMIYSFVKAPSFTAEKQDDGKFKIVEKEGKSRAQNISAMLTITPRAWRNPFFGGAFQLGISPVKDQIGIFGGVQLRLAKYATIGGGYGYQQVPRLDGQNPGDILAKADALKTSNHYKGGAYVSLLLSLPKEEK